MLACVCPSVLSGGPKAVQRRMALATGVPEHRGTRALALLGRAQVAVVARAINERFIATALQRCRCWEIDRPPHA